MKEKNIPAWACVLLYAMYVPITFALLSAVLLSFSNKYAFVKILFSLSLSIVTCTFILKKMNSHDSASKHTDNRETCAIPSTKPKVIQRRINKTTGAYKATVKEIIFWIFYLPVAFVFAAVITYHISHHILGNSIIAVLFEWAITFIVALAVTILPFANWNVKVLETPNSYIYHAKQRIKNEKMLHELAEQKAQKHAQWRNDMDDKIRKEQYDFYRNLNKHK